MKADRTIDPAMLAPCGIACMVCYRHLGKKPCAGCNADGGDRAEYCQRCKIRSCSGEKGVSHCFECAEFPCGLIKNIDKRYRTSYGVSLVENSMAAKERGIEPFLAEQLERYTCCACGGVISMHSGDCSACGKTYMLGRRSVKP